MLKIRLKRLGRKKKPFYRIVVIDIRARRDGAAIEELGYYNPLSRELKLDKASATQWISKGAQLTETAERLYKHAPETGELIVLEKAKKERLSKKAQDRAKQAEEAKKAAAEAEVAAKAQAAEAAAAKAAEPEVVAEAPAEVEAVAEEAPAASEDAPAAE